MAEAAIPQTSASRIAFLKKRVAAAEEARAPTAQVPFRGEQLHLPRIRVPAEFPRYRLQSGRTHRAQAEYLEQHGLSTDFFEDPESEEVQSAQHEILLAMIDQEGLRKDLLEREQLLPLVLTKDGFIVDGNRRTAALRAKGEEQLVAVVLPADAEAQDIYETELELQMARETKARYTWIDQALHVRYGIDALGESVDAVAARMRMGPDEITDLLGRLDLVDVYLDWLGHPGAYHRVGRDRTLDEQSFIELYAREQRPRFQQLAPVHQQAVSQACFAVIRHGGGYKDVRMVADHTINRLAAVTERVRDAEALPEELRDRLDAPVVVEGPGDAPPSLLDELADAGGGETIPEGAELVNLLAEAPAQPEVATVLIEVATDLTELENEKGRQGQPLRKVRRALTVLREVELDESTPDRPEIARTLAEVIGEAERLAEQIERLAGAGD